jgi:hypothetical protein
MEGYKKICEASIHKLTLYFLGLLKKYLKKSILTLIRDVIQVPSWLNKLPGFYRVSYKPRFRPFKILARSRVTYIPDQSALPSWILNL